MSTTKFHVFLMYGIGILFLFLPFSIAFDLGEHQLEMPNEPLIIIVGGLGFYYAILTKAWRLSFFRHPLFLVSMVYIGWAVICTFFSNHINISAKYTSVTLAHWWVYLCLFGLLFTTIKEQSRPWLLYGVSFALILMYAWWQHSVYDFRVDASVLVARPFYFDHALYACAALLILGLLVSLLWEETTVARKWLLRLFLMIFVVGVYLSFSRAAWLSLIGAVVICLSIYYLKLNFKQFLILVCAMILVVIMGLMWIIPQQGSQVLSKQGDSWQHLRSTVNVSTDVSNLERLNRYSCAWRMFKTKPVFGYGPGNFVIDYYAFQRPEEMTRLSVTEHQLHHRPGKGGGSHSEYLQALSEMGLIGLLLWLSLILVTIKTSIHIFLCSGSDQNKKITLGILLAVITFFIHSLFNNFFHQEKIIALVWSGLAALIWLDKE